MKPRYVLTSRGATLTEQAQKALALGVGARLRQERKRLVLSQDEIAALAGVSRNMWGQYERGNSLPGAAVLAALVHVGFDVQFILGGQPASEARA